MVEREPKNNRHPPFDGSETLPQLRITMDQLQAEFAEAFLVIMLWR
jgi:hypothetical protein